MAYMSSYMVSEYRSTFPTTRASSCYRSSSVDRTFRSSSSYDSSSSSSYGNNNRFARAATVGPCTSNESYNINYYGYMPFNRSLADIESRIQSRASSMAPVSTYRRAYHTTTPYGGQSTFDYKVADYASRLDSEETTRSYLNQYRSDFYDRRAAANDYGLSSNSRRLAATEVADRYRSDVDTRDLYTYKHYRKSNATLLDRNARAKSPILGRELDRYYKTEKRSDYMGDVSSGGVRDFRYYNYRAVPYFGGSDYYAYVPRIIKTWNNEIYPWYLPSHCG